MQKGLCFFILINSIISTISCTKKDDSKNTTTLPQLIKTVYKSNLSSDSVVTKYTYNANGSLVFIDIKYAYWETTYDLQRNPQGLLIKLIKREFDTTNMTATLEEYTTTPYYNLNSTKLMYAKTVSNFLPSSNYDSLVYQYNTGNLLSAVFTYKKLPSITDTASTSREYLTYNNTDNCINYRCYQRNSGNNLVWDLWDNNFYTYESNTINKMLSIEEAILAGLYEYSSSSSLKNYEANGLVTLKSTKEFKHTFNSLNQPVKANVIYTGAVFGFDNGIMSYYY